MVDLLGNLDAAFQYLSEQSIWWGLLLVAVSATVEYLFPPFPGDSVTVVAAMLIPKAGWPVTGVFGALLAGTVVGATVNWYVGRWLASTEREGTWIHRWLHRDSVASRVDTLHRQFDRWGSIYIVLNRFVPAFRALFFIAAGHAGLDLRKVLFWGIVGAALYNAALLAVGAAVGYNLEALAGWIQTYSRFFLLAVGIAVVAWIAAKIYAAYRN